MLQMQGYEDAVYKQRVSEVLRYQFRVLLLYTYIVTSDDEDRRL